MQATDHIDYKTPDQIAEATRQTVRETADGADAYTAGVAHASRTPEGGRVREWVGTLKQRGRALREQGGHYVADQPVRSMAMAAAGGAALTTLMMAALRSTGRR